MKLSFPAVKDAALYGLNVAFVQQPKGAIARHSANLARVAYVVSALGYIALSVKQAYHTHRTVNAPIKARNLTASNQFNDSMTNWKAKSPTEQGEKPKKPLTESLRPVYTPLFWNIGKAFAGYGLYAEFKALPSQAIALRAKLGF